MRNIKIKMYHYIYGILYCNIYIYIYIYKYILIYLIYSIPLQNTCMLLNIEFYK